MHCLIPSVPFPRQAGGVGVRCPRGRLSRQSTSPPSRFNIRISVFLSTSPSIPGHQTALLLVVLVIPTLHIVRAGIDENIAFLLLGFGIVLSDDRMEVVRIVTFYTWLLEGMCDFFKKIYSSSSGL